jgi:hypothetical protein
MAKAEIEERVLKAAEEYQCPGCVCGSDRECYENVDTFGVQCSKHVCGTTIMPVVGRIFLGLPTGFCRLGTKVENQKLSIFKDMDDLHKGWTYDKYNVPVWKHLNSSGHMLIRGLSPRTNEPFLHIILDAKLDDINCMEITSADIAEMD